MIWDLVLKVSPSLEFWNKEHKVFFQNSDDTNSFTWTTTSLINFGNGILGSYPFPKYKNGTKDFIFSLSQIFTGALPSDRYMLHQLLSLTLSRAWMKDWDPGSQITFYLTI